MPSNADLLNDPAFGADVDEDVDAAALGNDGAVDENADHPDNRREPAKKPAGKKVPDKDTEEEEGEEEEEEGEEEEEEEGDKAKKADKSDDKPDDDPEKAQMAKKLARAGRAREKLENDLREARAQLAAHESKMSDKSREQAEKLSKELDDLYEKVEEHRARGETREAAQVQRKIDKINGDVTRQQAAHLALTESIRQTETRAFNTMVSQLETIDPRFDKDHDDYDDELTRDVGEMTEAYEAKGMSPTDALRKACKTVLREDVFAPKRALTREQKAAKSKESDKAARKTNVEKNLDAAKRTPPDSPDSRREKSTELPDMETISEKDFDALPESTLRRILEGEA